MDIINDNPFFFFKGFLSAAELPCGHKRSQRTYISFLPVLAFEGHTKFELYDCNR
jgi:hypothetical protein